VAASAALAACAAGPDFHRPEAPVVSAFTRDTLPGQTAGVEGPDGLAQVFRSGLDVPADWWTLFGSTALNAMVRRSLGANPDLESARASLRVAQELARAQGAGLWPFAQASFSPSRQRVSAITTSPLNSGDSVFNLHTAQLSISYAPDVFGATRRAIESAQAQSEVQRFQVEAAYLTLTANVVVGAIQLASLRGQLEATQRSVQASSDQLEVLKRQRQFGQIADAAVLAQEAALAQARAALPPLQKQLQLQRDVLATLSGRFVADDSDEDLDLAALQLPAELPVSLPSELVAQRPDIQAAQAQLHAASAQIGVAVANRLPQLTLTASGGAMATRMSELTRADNVFWNLAANATQPLFDGAALLHRQRASQAAYEQAAAQYRSTVIAAFQNVADALEAIKADADALAAAVQAEQSARASLEIARRQLELGDVSPLSVMLAEQAWQQATIALVQARASRLADSAAMFQALGGGWWNRRN